MVVLVTIETVVLALMAVLIVGLLRSHAEILRRLEQLSPEASAQPGATAPDGAGLPPARDAVTPAFDIVGETLDGDAVKLSMATGRPGGTVLAFLSSGCLTCRAFWDGLKAGEADGLPGGPRVVVVSKDTSNESPSKLRGLWEGADAPLVLSTRAWEEYRIAGSPYFVHVGSGGQVQGEGTAESWGQVASLLRDALDDAAVAARRGSASGAERMRRAEAELASAGIGPGHPSLYGGVTPPDVVQVTGPNGEVAATDETGRDGRR
jgi:hypothetical protein